MWILVFSCLQHHACFVVIALSFFSLFSWKINAKNLYRTVEALLRFFLKNMKLCINAKHLNNFTCLVISVCRYSRKSFLCCWIYLFFGSVKAKRMLVVISLFTGVIFFILYARKSRLCFSVGKKEDTDLLFLSFFRRPSSSEVFQRYELLELSLEGGNRLSMFRTSSG